MHPTTTRLKSKGALTNLHPRLCTPLGEGGRHRVRERAGSEAAGGLAQGEVPPDGDPRREGGAGPDHQRQLGAGGGGGRLPQGGGADSALRQEPAGGVQPGRPRGVVRHAEHVPAPARVCAVAQPAGRGGGAERGAVRGLPAAQEALRPRQRGVHHRPIGGGHSHLPGGRDRGWRRDAAAAADRDPGCGSGHREAPDHELLEEGVQRFRRARGGGEGRREAARRRCLENIPTLPAADWSVVRIYPRFLRLIALL
eukprot:8041656-Pyramimonas_sp.AAC.2